MNKIKTYYLFVDTETANLNYSNTTEYIENPPLEISAVLTDKFLNVICELSETISTDSHTLNKCLSKYSKNIHSINNLLNDVSKSSKSCVEIDTEINYLLGEFTEDNSIIILAGNSINFDLEVIRRYFPLTYSKLHFRVLDISSIREFISIVNNKFIKKINKNKKYIHRANSDIKESIKELKVYIDYLDKETNCYL